ncbi:endonuclease domain-containing protein [Agrilutibacter solisilvae]|uniref:Endonuclease domain-containing protein n=1 Tax=Agrilutibacter solisilvae TaxID=2763317 RepID=A0A974XZK2_9GAMM|nr:endonuclease domain-containing protein [Lysobacter solisilvae]QSX78538.1 endonuclease domain-containing protein [Lysobacter solisilvae]
MRLSRTTQNARALRRLMTDAERRLWRVLRHRQVQGCRFRRQHPIGPYIADFACLERGLVIEVDGSQHAVSTTDPTRDAYLRRHGYRVLRVWNHDVLQNIEGVCQVIAQLLGAGHVAP